MQKYKVGAYLRLSKEEFSNEKESNSITNQKLIINNYLKEHKEYVLVDYYIKVRFIIIVLITIEQRSVKTINQYQKV